jgi:hypothetical protein
MTIGREHSILAYVGTAVQRSGNDRDEATLVGLSVL